ncbi:MAG: right-handed parallel beta-helix repeat-containing protein, partial [Candidatus Thermoplasmatota archaeon]|nr:right-handed parallel beta-helix repeat-containing protein [Candidatus Thermoplasmatota archaeon]
MGNNGNALLSVLILINVVLFTCSIPIMNENTTSFSSPGPYQILTESYTNYQSSSRAVIHVKAGGGQQFLKVQDGVNAANPGDTVFIHNGVYSEHVTVSKGVTLQGESSNGTIIDAGGTGTGIYVTANSVIIKRLTVRNAPQSHSAIKLSVSQNCEISQCNITGNDDGITLWAAVSNTIHNNNISGNNGWNGGIYIENSNSNRVYGNTIISNDWVGIKLSGADDNGIDNNTISNNSNGIMLYGASAGTDVHYNDIYGNDMWGVFVYNVNALQVDGRNNWWGNSSGPNHATGNPQGSGDNISDHITFIPWLRSKRDNEAPVIGTSDITSVLEDSYYKNEYSAADPDRDEMEWTFGTNASWLHWGTDNHTIHGRPDNSH